MFDGSMLGNVLGAGYLLLFQLLGIFLMQLILRREKLSAAFITLLGSVAGSVAMQWLPVLFAFFVDFTVLSHLLGLGAFVLLCGGVWYALYRRRELDSLPVYSYRRPREWVRLLRENPCVFLMAAGFVFFFYCLLTHTLPQDADGSLHTGQGTYGDMNMHLSFITSIANQHTFPPEYSIYPGVRLSYPFLCDSVSSSLYLFGASLRFAYIVPMLVAILQVFGGFYCLMKYWLQRASSALVAWIFFFLNGGLGFVYFTDGESLQKLLTEFYYTPTSLGDKNLRFAQIIVNMLIPQRATLFGWAVLFPLLALLLYCVRSKSRRAFLLAGIFSGALPMIHTHSFLALACVCVMWLWYDLGGSGKWLAAAPLIGLAGFSILQFINDRTELAEKNGLLIFGIGFFVLFCGLLYRLWRRLANGGFWSLFWSWGVYLLAVLFLALPQLLFWTLGQASSDGFVRSHFNWSNDADQYVWFYLKNIGLSFVLYLVGGFVISEKKKKTAAPLFLIWFLAELVVFQPNEYDNNKLLFVAFAFLCGVAADGAVMLYKKIPKRALRCAVCAVCLFFCTVSAVMTMAREWVSDYTLYSAEDVEACRFIEEKIPASAVILTGTNHNHPVPALTGRNIVCGSGTFLYYHGIDYTGREQEVTQMYENAADSADLFTKNNVSYIYVSGQEYSLFDVDEDAIAAVADCIYNEDDVRIYRLKD